MLPLLVCCIAFASAALLTGIANVLESIAWRRSAGMHWTERARRLQPVREAGLINLVAIPVFVTLSIHQVAATVPWMPALAAAYLGSMFAFYPLERLIFPELTFKFWLHQAAVTLITRSVRWLTPLTAAALMPPVISWITWLISGAYMALHCALLFGLGIRLLRLLRVLHPASQRLAALATETSARMGITVRAVSELSSPIAAAFAFVTTRELAFTTKLLALAPDEEVKAICAHELGHLSETRGVFAVRILGSFIILPLIFVRPAYASSGTDGLVALIAATCLLWVGRVQLTRKMEKRADQIALDHTADSGIYARALERLYEANQMPAVLRDHTLQSHPDLYDRMVAANAPPAYPRPLPPRSTVWSSWVVIAAAVVLALRTFGVGGG